MKCSTCIARLLSLVALFLLVPSIAAAIENSNRGNEFILGFIPNFSVPSAVEVHLTADTAVDVLVEYPINSPTFSNTFSVLPGAVTIVSLPVTADTLWVPNTVLNNSVRLSGAQPFAAYLINRRTASSDAALALPVATLNTQYIAATYDPFNSTEGHSEVGITAAYDNTTVTIMPTQNLLGGGSAGVPFNVVLNRGQGYLIQAQGTGTNGGLTGTIVTSDKPVFMMNGHKCAQVPFGVTACDTIFEVAQPVQTWGTGALVANLPLRPGGSIYRILASEDDTTVTMDGNPVTSTHTPAGPVIDRGQFLEVGPIAGNHSFSADKPIFVVQYMTGVSSPGATTGDPAMGNMSPPEQYANQYTFSPVGGGQFSENFLTIIAHNLDVGTLVLDGVAVDPSNFTAIPGTNFSAAAIPLGPGTHSTSSLRPHGITVEGYNSADSYLYPGGVLLKAINPAGDSNAPICTVDPFSQFGTSATGTGTDNRPSEDTNANGSLDPGEDLNGDEKIDKDTGIFFIELLPGSVNLQITNVPDPLVPGGQLLSYTVEAIDPSQPSSGTIRITDGAGNSCESSFLLSQTFPPAGDSNPPSCKVQSFAPDAIRIVVNGGDNRASEDVNGNRLLDPGEDLNGNGQIDGDTGIWQVELLPESENLILVVQPFTPGSPSVIYGVALVNTENPGSGTLRITDGGGNTCESRLTVPGTGSCGDGPTPDPNILDTSAIRQRDPVVKALQQIIRGTEGRSRRRARQLLNATSNTFQSNWVTANLVPEGAAQCPQLQSSACGPANLSTLKDDYNRNARRLSNLGRQTASLLEQTGIMSRSQIEELRTKIRRRLRAALRQGNLIPEEATLCVGTEEPNPAGISSIGGERPVITHQRVSFEEITREGL